MTIESLINNLTEIINFFVPGYIYLMIFSSFTTKKEKEIEYVSIKSVVLSYVFIIIARTICPLMKIDSTNELCITLLLSAILSIVSVRIYYSDVYKSICTKLGKVSGHSSIWEDLFDRNRGANIRGYIKYRNDVAEIRGTIYNYEVLSDGSCSIVLWNYTITGEDFELAPMENSNKVFYIKSDDIEGLEIFKG